MSEQEMKSNYARALQRYLLNIGMTPSTIGSSLLFERINNPVEQQSDEPRIVERDEDDKR